MKEEKSSTILFVLKIILSIFVILTSIFAFTMTSVMVFIMSHKILSNYSDLVTYTGSILGSVSINIIFMTCAGYLEQKALKRFLNLLFPIK